MQTAERVSHTDISDNYVFQRSQLAYYEALKLIEGTVLEIGSGQGYGMQILAPKATRYIALDKYPTEIIQPENAPKIEFIQTNVPPLSPIDDESVDFVVSFQVIEHIKNDKAFVKEIFRVLKPGGAFIVSTPNIKMSLTRNPWHIREYTVEEFKKLLASNFDRIEAKGVFGNEKIMQYYAENKKNVEKITRFDVFNLQYLLPRQLLQIPYDILNRRNRKKILNGNNNLVAGIKMNDYHIADANDLCFDLFYIAKK
ncbi:MAG: methyltransferase domain-containing protein [Bacteroidales bacterium]|nr:methyltransferase domain-containing protein [Bacteroidales bacterium]